MSPARATWSEHSWYHGLVRSPTAQSRVSIHSPPERMFSWWSSAQISCSVLPVDRVLVHPRHARLADADRPAHERDLVRALDQPRLLGELLALDQRDAVPAERVGARRVELVDRQPQLAAAGALAQRRNEVDRPSLHPLGQVLGRVHVEPGQRRAHLVHRLEALGEVGGRRVLEVDRVAVGEDQRAVDRAVRRPTPACSRRRARSGC